MQEAMRELRALSIQEGERRGKRATGRTFDTLSTYVVQGPNSVTGVMEGEEQWRYVGNGRGPGKMPPLQPIAAWVAARGLDISAWAVARSIAKRGSKDWRNRAPNVFVSAFEDWQKDGAGRFENKLAGTFEQQVMEVTINNLKR